MLSNLDPSARQFLNQVGRIQSRMDRAQQQIASGLRVTVASDAPDQVSTLLKLHAEIQQNQDYISGLNQVKTEVDAGEQAISSAVDLMERAIVLAAQATGPLQTAETRAGVAGEIGALIERLVSIANTSVSGRYIFSGDNDQAASYQLNPASPTGVDQLQSVTNTRQVQEPGGSTFSPSRTAAQMFDPIDTATALPAAENAFAVLSNLRNALLANLDSGISSSVAAIKKSSVYLNQHLSFYGQNQTRIAAGLDQTQQIDIRLRVQLGASQDADATSAIIELTQAKTQLQAAMELRAQLPRTSLFDLL
jgi:flagellar hook-associated protein 3 FlgL